MAKRDPENVQTPGDGPMARRHRVLGKRLRHSAGSQLSFATASDDLRHRPKIQALTAVTADIIRVPLLNHPHRVRIPSRSAL